MAKKQNTEQGDGLHKDGLTFYTEAYNHGRVNEEKGKLYGAVAGVAVGGSAGYLTVRKYLNAAKNISEDTIKGLGARLASIIKPFNAEVAEEIAEEAAQGVNKEGFAEFKGVVNEVASHKMVSRPLKAVGFIAGAVALASIATKLTSYGMKMVGLYKGPKPTAIGTPPAPKDDSVVASKIGELNAKVDQLTAGQIELGTWKNRVEATRVAPAAVVSKEGKEWTERSEAAAEAVPAVAGR